MIRLLILPLILAVLQFASCASYNDSESVRQLARAAQAMRDNPEEVAELLKSVNPDELARGDYYTYMLIQARQLRRDGVDISFMELAISDAIDYFTKLQDAQNACIANYTMAKVYESKDKPADAVRYYFLADEWAVKSNYHIANFIYPDIPYNIASHYNSSGLYKQATIYLHKALQYVDNYNDYQIKLYTLELLGSNFDDLNVYDSAFYYYDKAKIVAIQNDDMLAQNRIIFNNIYTLFKSNDYEYAEVECKNFLEEYKQKDCSNIECLANIALSKIYYNTNRFDKAFSTIYKARELIDNVDNKIKLALLEQLSMVEKNENVTLFNAYQEQYNTIKAKQELEKQKMLAELQINVKKREQEFLAQNVKLVSSSYQSLRKAKQAKAIGFALAALAVVLAAGWRFADQKKRREKRIELIVRGITAKYAKARNDARLVEFINEMTEDDELRFMLLDDLDTSSLLSSDSYLLNPFKRKLFGAEYDPCIPILTDIELELCYLISTQRYTPVQVMEMLGINASTFVGVRESLERKLAEGGYKLPHGYKAMQAKTAHGYLVS